MPRITKQLTTPLDHHQPQAAPFTVVTISAREMMEKMRSGLVKQMRPCVYNPGSNELKMIAIQ